LDESKKPTRADARRTPGMPLGEPVCSTQCPRGVALEERRRATNLPSAFGRQELTCSSKTRQAPSEDQALAAVCYDFLSRRKGPPRHSRGGGARALLTVLAARRRGRPACRDLAVAHLVVASARRARGGSVHSNFRAHGRRRQPHISVGSDSIRRSTKNRGASARCRAKRWSPCALPLTGGVYVQCLLLLGRWLRRSGSFRCQTLRVFPGWIENPVPGARDGGRRPRVINLGAALARVHLTTPRAVRCARAEGRFRSRTVRSGSGAMPLNAKPRTPTRSYFDEHRVRAHSPRNGLALLRRAERARPNYAARMTPILPSIAQSVFRSDINTCCGRNRATLSALLDFETPAEGAVPRRDGDDLRPGGLLVAASSRSCSRTLLGEDQQRELRYPESLLV